MRQDSIELHGLRVLAIIGVLEHERHTPQPLEIDITLYLDLQKAGQSDALTDTVDYGNICVLVEKVIASQADLLLERLATRIAEAILEQKLIDEVKIHVKKLKPPVSSNLVASAVTIYRKQTNTILNSPKMHLVTLSLGSNLGNRAEYLRLALKQLGNVCVQSQVFETKPVGVPSDQPTFFNMVVLVETPLDPFALLRKCLEIEAKAGRERKIKYEARTLDIDILFYEEIRIDSPFLTIPHPLIYERGFVLYPLAEVSPEKLDSNWMNPFNQSDILPLGNLNDLI